jgi:hypothetical protein
VDCRQKLQWAESEGGPAVPKAVIQHERPLDIVYFGNSFAVETGAENLAFFKLRDGCRSTNMVASCCHTTMMVDNPGYQEQAVLAFVDILAGLETEPIDFSLYGFCDDFPQDKRKKLRTDKPQLGSPSKGSADWGDASWAARVVGAVSLPDVTNLKLTNFQEVLREKNGNITYLGLEEGAEIH